MNNNVIIDNWSLFDIKELVTDEKIRTKNINYLGDSETDYLVKQFITLLNFLVDLISRDTIVTARGTQIAWIGHLKTLDQLVKDGIITDIRNNKTDADKQEINILKESFKLSDYESSLDDSSENKHHSFHDTTLIDGTAEYLYTSSQNKTFYSPHPFRAEFLKLTMFPFLQDGNQQIKNWIKVKRANIIEKVSNESEFRIGLVPLDPFLIEIIENSNSPYDLFETALQLRNQYKGFRNYLKEYQESLNDGDLKSLLKHERMLNEIQNKILDFKDPNKYGSFSISLGLGFFKYSKSYPLIDSLIMRNGVRATIQKLVLKPASDKTIDKLLKIFDLESVLLKEKLLEKLTKQR
ncbi:MAG: hypothetical protein NXH90_15235 [Flavobacteriaceae bacterium]|nr:hypothetical protein [Flavobacteriaceae bacterium]